VGVWIAFIWLRIGTERGGGGSCEHGDELLGSVRGTEFLD
jgi:hypothetical protein